MRNEKPKRKAKQMTQWSVVRRPSTAWPGRPARNIDERGRLIHEMTMTTARDVIIKLKRIFHIFQSRAC